MLLNIWIFKKKNEPLNVININIQSLNLKIATAYAYSYISKSVFIMQFLTFPYKKIILKDFINALKNTEYHCLNLLDYVS